MRHPHNNAFGGAVSKCGVRLVQAMPLTAELMKVVVDALQHADPPKRRRAFEALRPVLNLSDSEMDPEFDRVEGALRYVAQVERDLAVLRRVHMHAVPCKVQAALRGKILTGASVHRAACSSCARS